MFTVMLMHCDACGILQIDILNADAMKTPEAKKVVYTGMGDNHSDVLIGVEGFLQSF